jgi:ABC-type branched-subunit amino acid transport system ATPase component
MYPPGVRSGPPPDLAPPEQFAEEALAVADTAIVLKLGRPVTSGTAAVVRDDDAVRAAYLGA